MILNLLFGLVLLLSLFTVIVTFKLIQVTDRKLAWILITIGLLVVSVRRILMFLDRFIESAFLSSPYLTPIAALIMSVMLFVGLLLVVPVFQTIKCSEERYRSIFDTSGVSLWEENHYELYMLLEELKKTGVTDLRAYIADHPEFVEAAIKYAKIIDVNQATLNLFKSDNKKLFMRSLGSTFTPQSMFVFIDLLVSIFNGNNVFESEIQYKDLEGNYLDAIFKVVDPEKKEAGKTSIVSITDITTRVETEKKLLTILEEKNTLLRELYHRTKNNMQVIIAMLNLRSSMLKEKSASIAFNEIIDKIQSMSLVHEKLYKSENLTVIKLDEYIQDLLNLIVYNKSHGVHEISIIFDLESVNVDIDKAIPCGLIINELLSNINRHAFINQTEREIKVSLHNLIDEQAELIIQDNGEGMPEGYTLDECDTLGLKTVIALGEEQLHGKVELISPIESKGTMWRLVFSIVMNKKRL
jgi:two-component sensor histidine kinase/PAS domain-containing protein